MRKTLIVSLVLAMLVVFSGVANAATGVFMSCIGSTCGQISFLVTNIDEKQVPIGTTGLDQTYLHPTSRVFEGYLVANVSGLPDGPFAIPEVFFSGKIINVAKATSNLVQVDFTNFATAASDVYSGSKDANQSATLRIIGTGDLYSPPGPGTTPPVAAIGIDYLNATATGEYFGHSNTLSKILVSGVIGGGFSDEELLYSDTSFVFTGPFVTTLVEAPGALSFTNCTTGATCSSTGTVICAP